MGEDTSSLTNIISRTGAKEQFFQIQRQGSPILPMNDARIHLKVPSQTTCEDKEGVTDTRAEENTSPNHLKHTRDTSVTPMNLEGQM